MASNTVGQHPRDGEQEPAELPLQRDRASPLDVEAWFATKAQLQAAGIGLGCTFPGEEDGPPRGMTVRDRKGRRFRIRFDKWRQKPGTPLHFRAVLVASPADRAIARSRRRAAEVTKQLDSLKDEPTFRQDARWAMTGCRRMLDAHMLGGDGDVIDEQPWRYSASVMARVHSLFDQLLHLVETGAVEARPQIAKRLKEQRAALLDEPLQAFLCRVALRADRFAVGHR